MVPEKQKNIQTVEKLGFSKCRVSIAVPKEIETDDPAYFQGKKIATSYPNTLRNFLNQKGIEADIHVISGSVEIAPNIGLADGICDIVYNPYFSTQRLLSYMHNGEDKIDLELQ